MSGECLLLLESAGNQAYIFASNRLRQNVGASELTAQSCGRWVLEEVGSLTGQALWEPDTRYRALALLTAEPVDRVGAEVLVATSGRALVRFADPGQAREALWKVTHRALRDAPGLALTGVVVEPAPDERLHYQIRRATRALAGTRDRLPAPAARFRRVPLVRDCATSGLPAESLVLTEDGRRLREVEPDAPVERTHEALSAAARARRRAAGAWFDRLAAESAITAGDRLPRRLEELEDAQAAPWIGVVHADGNGIGTLFSAFDQRCGARDDAEYGSRLRAFSLGLELTTLEAFDRALRALPERGERPPVVPLILGGDDLTAMVEGACAVRFAHAYVEAWRELSQASIDPVDDVVREVSGGGLSARAGIAIVKPHFPFHAAYGLCEALAAGAKLRDAAGGPLGALDFHVLHDASDADLDRIRAERVADGGRLWTGPYAVATDPDQPPSFSELRHRVDAMRAEDDGRRRLSAALLHRLRARLFEGAEAADAELALARPAYDPVVLAPLTYAPEDSLVDRSDGAAAWRTAYLDALDLVDLWDGWGS
jgi:hypothetical protein